MSEPTKKHLHLENPNAAFDALQGLQAQATMDLVKMRAHERKAVKMTVTLRPANPVEAMTFELIGVTGDLSEGGCQAMFPVPPQVGEVYRLRFGGEGRNLSEVFGRCLRSRLVDEESFETGFRFFQPLDLSPLAR